MKLTRKNQILIFSSIAALTSSIVISRNLIQPNSDKFLQQISEETAEKWERELSLSTGQTERMQRKIAEFATKKNKVIMSSKTKEVKRELLQKLQVQENREIEQLLDDSQYSKYLYLLDRSIKGQHT